MFDKNSDIICVTDRKLCCGDFLEQVEAIARCRPAAIILREKDLKEMEYEELAARVMEICGREDVLCVLHSFAATAARLSAKAIHMPMGLLRSMSSREKSAFSIIGASCHSPEEAVEAQRLGCSYVTAGHVFATDCKKGIEPRGTGFLENVCNAVTISVYGIGGINPGNIDQVRATGAAGACVMSGLMTCDRPEAYLAALTSGLRDDGGATGSGEVVMG